MRDLHMDGPHEGPDIRLQQLGAHLRGLLRGGDHVDAGVRVSLLPLPRQLAWLLPRLQHWWWRASCSQKLASRIIPSTASPGHRAKNQSSSQKHERLDASENAQIQLVCVIRDFTSCERETPPVSAQDVCS